MNYEIFYQFPIKYKLLKLKIYSSSNLIFSRPLKFTIHLDSRILITAWGPFPKTFEINLKGNNPVNELDKAAQFHDMAYSIFKDTKDRHVFDKKLQDEAFNLVKNSSTSLKDRAEAGLVGGVLLAKRKLGLGVRQKR
jgi:hypothetical protein